MVANPQTIYATLLLIIDRQIDTGSWITIGSGSCPGVVVWTHYEDDNGSYAHSLHHINVCK